MVCRSYDNISVRCKNMLWDSNIFLVREIKEVKIKEKSPER